MLWTHNDSGDGPRLLAVAPGGELLGAWTVAGAGQVDWEDVAAADGDLFVADLGDNDRVRPEAHVYRVPEPARPAGGGTTAPAVRYTLRYPDGPQDVEALLVDPRRGDLLLASRDFAGVSRVYGVRGPLPAAGGELRVRLVGTLRTEPGFGGAVTAGSVSPDGRVAAVRTYERLYVWARRGTEPLARTLRRRPCRSPTRLREPQGEALALARGGRSALTVTEGARPAIRRYRPAR